ncbi:MAG: hypothetical protein Q8P17_00105 [bacterium]|nr:hypothetical protein [bacterium]
MVEQAPQSEKKYGEMVPEYVFDKTWQDANFSIPTNEGIRNELRREYEEFSHYGVMSLPENQKAKTVLLSRIASIQAYDAKIPRAKEQVSNQMESRKERIAALSAELIESNETFSFPGIDPEAYLKLKTDIAAAEGMSLYDVSSPTLDELIEMFQKEGMRVTLGDTPQAGNVFIIPAGRSDYYQPSRPPGVSNMVMQDYSLSSKHLQTSEVKEKLDELVLLKKQVRSFEIR